ncbi:hypothetical protein SA87_06350 [Hydrogenibacillus schlegelii]|uniref:HTH lysR-type domain-containing protein n=3 Tax=Hydrogenibacillus schlegelii TaxID=1484 RepID=A0A179IQM1_HYDSH|nr:hypothetical protein SA87_06350 [Hydrogenibacillus schlegelii]
MMLPFQVFVAVYELKNFTRAAERLYLTQPAVSGHIQQLESTFGVQLFTRSPRKVVPTAAGEALYARAKRLLAEYDAMVAELERFQASLLGPLHIGASLTVGESVLPRLIGGFARRYPRVDIEVTVGNTEEIVEKVAVGALDVGFVEGRVERAGVERRPWLRDTLALLVAPGDPLADQAEIPVSDLKDRTWIVREHGSGTRAFVERFFAEFGLSPRRRLVFSSNTAVKEAVMSGLGVSLLSRFAARREIAHGELLARPIAGADLARSFDLVWRTGAHTPRAEALFSYARSWAEEADEEGVEERQGERGAAADGERPRA